MPRPKLDDGAITKALETLPGWAREGDRIVRRVELPTFRAAVALVNRIADLAEGADHHPDLHLSWRRLSIELTTHDSGGITARDVHLARVIEDVITHE